MCKTEQPIPDEQGQHAPDLSNPQTSGSGPIASADAVELPGATTGHSPNERFGPTIHSVGSNDRSPSYRHTIDDRPNRGCGCLVIGLLIVTTSAMLWI